MNLDPRTVDEPLLLYPDRDGKPMSDNTRQFEWIMTIKGGLDAVFRQDPNVFVAGDLLWYPVEGSSAIRTAPDAMVVLGRPKGHRGSYQQWLEGGIAPQVVFEVQSPGNRFEELLRKYHFYEQYGVEEYYLYDPDNPHLVGWRREGDHFADLGNLDGWVSPRLGIRFDLSGSELQLFGPDGQRFVPYAEVAAQRDQERQEKEQAQQQATAAAERAERLAAKLRALGIDPEA